MMLEVNNKRYVYFDEDGNITSIKNNYKELGNYIVVDIADVYNLITGKEVVSNYVVLFDTVTKQHILSHRYIEDEYQFDINNQIYLVPTNNKVRPDVIITHSKKERKWTIELDRAIQDNLLSNKLSFRSDMGFSITKAHDPHVLYQYIYCAIDDLKNGKIKVDFASDLELDSSAVSVYTIKRFEKYSYEVVE